MREINAYIFQDLPDLGADYKPGIYRDEIPAEYVWHKERKLKNSNDISMVCYSNMDKGAIDSLDSILSRVDPKEFAKLD